jgi:hypothetical protein
MTDADRTDPDGTDDADRVWTPDGLDAAGIRRRLRGYGPSRRTMLSLLGAAGAGAALARGGEVVGALSGLAPGGSDERPPGGNVNRDALALVPDEEATHRAVNSGRWDDGSTWRGGVPGDGARAVIEPGVRVRLRHRDVARLDWLRVDGTLSFDPKRDTHLGVETLVTTPGSLLEVGRDGSPVRPDRAAGLTFVDSGPIDPDSDPNRLGRGLLAMGAVRVVGSETTSWSALAEHPRPGDRTLTLPDAPTNWGPGDRVVVPGTNPEANEDEEAAVRSVEGATVHLDRALDFDHTPAAPDLDSYVVHLDRNVRFRSESSETKRRGHLMFMAPATTLRYAGMYDLGRTDKTQPFTDPIHGTPPEDAAEAPNVKARYACHFHVTGIEAPPHEVEGCVVRGSPGWGYVNHHSHAHVTDSVSYRVTGAGFVAEAGNERGSFRRNFALRSAGSGEFLDSRRFRTGEEDPGKVDDFGHGGHGFWFQGPTTRVEGNVAAGHRYYAFVYWNRPLVDWELRPGEEIDDRRGTVANFPLSLVEGREPLKESDHVTNGQVSSAYLNLALFRDNTAFASAGGLDVSRHQFGWDHTRIGEWSVVEGFTAHDVGPFTTHWGKVVDPDHGNRRGGNAGITVRYSHNLRIVGARLVSGRGRDGVGLNRNVPYPFHVSVEDSEITGFERGLHAMVRGVTNVEDTRLVNRRNLVVEEEHHHPTRRIRLADVRFERGTVGSAPGLGTDEDDEEGYRPVERAHLALELDELSDLGPRELFSPDSTLLLDGREVYFEEQAPEYVPVPDREALSTLGHHGQLSAFIGEDDPSSVVGLTNRELYERWGFAVKGRPVPAGAVRDDRVTGWLQSEAEAARAVWLDAEDGEIESPWVVAKSESAGGGEYLTTRGVESTDEPPRVGHLRYPFSVPAGRYHVRGRVRAPDGDSDSFWVRVDDLEWHRWDGMRTRRGWEWESVPDHEGDGDLTFDLDGEHTLTVAFREDGTKLDRLVVTESESLPVLFGERSG